MFQGINVLILCVKNLHCMKNMCLWGEVVMKNGVKCSEGVKNKFSLIDSKVSKEWFTYTSKRLQ